MGLELLIQKTSAILSHPLLIAAFLFYLGKKFGFDEFITSQKTQKSVEIKEKIIFHIIQVLQHLKTFRIEHDRIVNTIEFAKKNSIEYSSELKHETLMKMSHLINEEIPLELSNIESSINAYFNGNMNVKNGLHEYFVKLKVFINFATSEYTNVVDFAKKADKYPELGLNDIENNQNEFIKIILKEKSIWE
jgi:hypothetical protein